MEKGLISVITPCYNTGKYISHLLDSVLNQTYPNVEMYAIDDGSTDETASVIKSYIPKFQARNYKLHYVYEDNSGQSVAINKALKLVQGEFLVWPDSDDFYASNDALSILKNELDHSEHDVSMVRSLCSYVRQENLSLDYELKDVPDMHKDYFFEDCLFQINSWFYCAGAYMVRMSVLDECIPNRNIYTDHNAGQNWQLLIPLLYSHKCITIPQHLYNVVEREDSHSRGQYKTYNQKKSKICSYENTILGTLDRMPYMDKKDYDKYYRAIRIKYAHMQLELALEHHNLKAYKAIRDKLVNKLSDKLTKREILMYYLSRIPYGLDIAHKIKHLTKGL